MAFDGSRAEFYRQSARRLRELAARYKIDEIKATFERIAKQYEKLADQVDRTLLRR